MLKYTWDNGCVTFTGEWTSWLMAENIPTKVMHDDTWIHHLYSHPDESNPDANHIHIKFKQDGSLKHSFVLCSVKVDGMREVNRRELIDSINRATGLDISYR